MVDHDLTFVCVESGPSGDVGVDPRLPSGSVLAGQRRRLPEQEQSSGGEYPAQLPHDRELLVRIHVVQGLTDPDHVDRVLPVREHDPVVAVDKSDRTVESGQLDLGQVEQGARQVDADIAADLGVAQRADRRHGVAAADVDEPERPRRVLDQRAMERRVDVAMEDVAEVADFPVRLPALQEIALVPCLQPLRPVNHGAPPPRHHRSRPPASCHRMRDRWRHRWADRESLRVVATAGGLQRARLETARLGPLAVPLATPGQRRDRQRSPVGGLPSGVLLA